MRATWFVFAVAVTVLLSACEKQQEDPKSGARTSDASTRSGEVRESRNLSAADIDTLVEWKHRYKVTRDEYWDDHGGVVGNEYYEVWYPPGKVTVSQGMYVLKKLTEGRPAASRLLGELPARKITVTCAWSIEGYKEQTGKEWWLYSKVGNDTIQFQPVRVLAQRGIIDQALLREWYVWLLQQRGGKDAPQWLIEGVASYAVGEDRVLTANLGEFPEDPVVRTEQEIESALEMKRDKKAFRIALFNALKMVQTLIERHGEQKVVSMLGSIGEGRSRDDAAQSAFGVSYDTLLTSALEWQEGFSR